MTTQSTWIAGYSRTNPDGTVELISPAPELEREPGEIWVEKLPGHSRAAFVRKRKPYRPSPFGLTAIAGCLSCSSRAKTCDTIKQANAASSAPEPTRFLVRSLVPLIPFTQPTGGQTVILTPQPLVSQGAQNPPPAVIENQPPAVVQNLPPPVVQVAPADVVTESGVQPALLIKQTCIECGNVRSPRYQLRHALKPGEMPSISICKKCATRETSSEDSDSSYDRYRKKNRRRHRRTSRTTDDGSSYTREFRSHRTERYHSPSRHGRHSRRTGTRSDSTDRARAVYARTHASRRSPSPERVYTVRRIRYVDQASPSRSRGRSRTVRSRHGSWAETSETYTNNGGDLGYTSRADESPRTYTAEHDRRDETVIPELGVPHSHFNSIRGSPRDVDGQEFDRRPVIYTSDDRDHRTAPSAEAEVIYTSDDRDHRTAPSAEAEEILRPSTSPRLIPVAHGPQEQRLRSRSVRSARAAQESDEARPRSRSGRNIHFAGSDEPRPRSRSVRVARVSQEDEGPRSYVTDPADQDRTYSTRRYTNIPDAHLREYHDRPRSSSARVPLLPARTGNHWSPGRASDVPSSVSRYSSRRRASTEEDEESWVEDEWWS